MGKPRQGKCFPGPSPRISYHRSEVALRSGAVIRNGKDQPIPLRVVYWKGRGARGLQKFRRACVKLAIKFDLQGATFLPEGLIAMECWGSENSLSRLYANASVARMEYSTAKPYQGPKEQHGPSYRKPGAFLSKRDEQIQASAARLAAREAIASEIIDGALGEGRFDSLPHDARVAVWDRAMRAVPDDPGLVEFTPRASRLQGKSGDPEAVAYRERLETGTDCGAYAKASRDDESMSIGRDLGRMDLAARQQTLKDDARERMIDSFQSDYRG